MITKTNFIEDVVKTPFITGDLSRNLGRRYNEQTRLFLRKNIKPAGKVAENNTTLLYSAPESLAQFLSTIKTVEVRYYNQYSELITDDLKFVTPIVSGKFKNIIPEFTSIQREHLSDDNHLIVQFMTTNECFCVTKFDLTDIYIGSIPDFVARFFVAKYKEFSFEAMQWLLDRGYTTDLRPIVETIGTLNLAFKPEQINWMKLRTS